MPHDIHMVNRDFKEVTIRGWVYSITDTEKGKNYITGHEGDFDYFFTELVDHLIRVVS